MKKLFVVIFCLALALVVSGCGEKAVEKAAETAIEQSTGGQADVDIGTNSIKVNTNEGSLQVGGNISLPSGFPSDVHVIDGTITAATTVTEGEAYTVSIETSKSVAAAKSEYETELKNDGWNVTLAMTFEGGATLAAEKDNRSVSVSMSESDGKTLVVLGTSTTEE